jgi:hypothetical protein
MSALLFLIFKSPSLILAAAFGAVVMEIIESLPTGDIRFLSLHSGTLIDPGRLISAWSSYKRNVS